jgi:hypothetical protein
VDWDDDDDWHAPNRLSSASSSGHDAALCGTAKARLALRIAEDAAALDLWALLFASRCGARIASPTFRSTRTRASFATPGRGAVSSAGSQVLRRHRSRAATQAPSTRARTGGYGCSPRSAPCSGATSPSTRPREGHSGSHQSRPLIRRRWGTDERHLASSGGEANLPGLSVETPG